MTDNESKQEWATKVGVIMAVSGSAVGLGNFLRFPGEVAKYGGGAFMIPYFIALLLLGIPIGWAEWTMGRYGGQRGFHSAPAILGAVGKSRVLRYVGVIGVLIPLAVSFFYTYIEAWCLGYAWFYLTGGIGVKAGGSVAEQTHAASAFFNHLVGFNSDGFVTITFLLWAITFAINVWLIYRGISGGIEKFCQWAMPAMAVCALIVLGRVLTLGTPSPLHPHQNVVNGLAYMWNPHLSSLAHGQTWLAAAGQIFFSLSVGFGVIINYASYMKRDSDVVLSGLTASATNEIFEVSFGGLITVTAAFVFLGLSGTINAVKGGTFGLGFKTLPVVFAHMGSIGNFIGFVWFFMLFLAAITSSISMYQPALAFFQETLGRSRKSTAVLLVTICVAGSLMVMYFSKGMACLGTINSWVGTFLIFIMATVELIAFAWMLGIDKGWEAAHQGAQIKIPDIYRFIMKYVAPIYLLVVFGAFCYQSLGSWVHNVIANPGSRWAMGLIVAVAALLVACTWLGEKRWEELGLGIEGRLEED